MATQSDEIRRRGKSALNASKHENGSGDRIKRSKAGGQASGSFLWVCLASAATIILLTVIIATTFPHLIPGEIHSLIAQFSLTRKLEYAVVLDAGSTGSRVLGFTFHRSPEGALVLDDELWMQVKPGLSAYADDPKGARPGLLELLEAAKQRVPGPSRSTTPISLKATAGLRMLPREQSEAILAEVRDVLENSGFQPEDNLIEIMNPLDEGLFGWFTVNFLLKQFEKVTGLSSTFASMDLGGGSTQITFAPSQPIQGIEGRKHFKHNVSVLSQRFEVYSHSYLGLGLQAARKAVLGLDNDLEGHKGQEMPVKSQCMTAKGPKKWSFQGKDYFISPKSGSSFQQCTAAVKQILTTEAVHQPQELRSRQIAAFSYFFDLPQEHGLIPEGKFEHLALVGDYKKLAQQECGSSGTGFNCFDLTFIYLLLAEGYGLPDNKQIHLYKKIDGHEASWALGLAYKILESK